MKYVKSRSVSMNKENQKSNAGFTMVEILVAVVAIGIMIISLANLAIYIGGIQRQTERLTLAKRTAEAKIESLRNNHYNTLTNSPPPIDFTNELPADLPSPHSATVTVSEPQSGLKRLDVSISYKDGNNNRQVKFSALIGNIGIAQ
jgi:prepilin-type N-terminal cleavage/methylation domain-containing protein